MGTIEELKQVRKWLTKQPQRHKIIIIIAGNHDWCFANHNRAEAETIMGGDGIIYLRDQSVTVEGLKIYGSPWQPWYYNWAFNLSRGKPLAEKWSLIPENLDLLMVHGPPHGYGDITHSGERAGCEDLTLAIAQKQPKAVIYGHIHENTGQWQLGLSRLINCSVGPNWMGRAGQPVLFELENNE